MDPHILVAGETLVDFIPDSTGPLADVEGFTRRAGGAPANVAVGLARLGKTPWFWTRVGDDPFGEFLTSTLADEGLSGRFVEHDPDAKTALAFVAHDPDADRSFTFYRNATADTRLERGRISSGILKTVEWVHVGGVTLATDPARTATLDLARRAAHRDCTVSFDPNARPELWETGDADFRATVQEVLATVDVVKATPEDLRTAGFEGDPATLARTVAEAGPHTVLLTLGGQGAVAHATGAAPWGPATATHGGYEVDVVDTTGAGDAFTAGAIAVLSGGQRNLKAALGFASAVAAVTTTAKGAMTALPDREAVRTFRKRET